MKKILLIILIIVVVGVAALILFQRKEVVRKSKDIIEEVEEVKEIKEVKEVSAKKIILTFELSESGISIEVDDQEPVLQSEKVAEFSLEKGAHLFSFSKAGFNKLKKQIDVVDDSVFVITLTKIRTVEYVPQPGFITINSIPEEAAILINNQKMGVTPSTIELDAGDYTIKLQIKNYHEFSQKFTLKDGETKEFDKVELRPQFAYYNVTATPQNAKIYLDNILVGNTPLGKTALSSGKHKLVVKSDLYHEYSKKFKVKDGEYRKFKIDLKVTFGSLLINSEPEAGAKVYFDEQLVGVTPYLDEHVAPGQYRIRVEKKLCDGAERIVTVREGKRTEETLIMTKQYALVTIDSPGSEIFINNKKVGFDHCEAKLVKGQYQVKCTKENFHWAVDTITADPAEDIFLFMEPEPMMVNLTVESNPDFSEGAEIWVNDKKLEESTPGVFDLLPGDYDISVKHEYFYDQSKRVSVTYSGMPSLIFKMKAVKGSPVARSIFWKRSKWTSFTSTMLLIGAGGYYNFQGDVSYDDYNNATSTSDALRFRKSTDNYLQKRDYAYSFSVVPAAWFFYSWMKQNHYQKKATERGEK